MDELLEEVGISWDREASLKRLKDHKALYPLNQIEYKLAGARGRATRGHRAGHSSCR